MSGPQKNFDILIAGAGPAGCAAALTLAGSGFSVGMLEREVFPRDKVCGDAIPTRAVKTLKKINPELAAELEQFDRLLLTRRTDVMYLGRTLELQWQEPAYTCTRMDFDNRLFEMVKNHTDTQVMEGVKVVKAEKDDSGCTITDSGGNQYRAKLLIGADGAQSVVARQLASFAIDREHHIGSVRAYYTGITGLDNNKTEIYLDKRFMPGYFWVFPIVEGMANVGFGMLSSDIAQNKVNLKTAFYDFIEAVPTLKERFAPAEQVGKLEGHSLPLGSRRVAMSGDHYMLVGDAASLIDPVTGDGIGNAMLSGMLAAKQAINCFRDDHFSAPYIHSYDDAVWKALGSELTQRAKAQKFFRRFPFALDALFVMTGWGPVKRLVQSRM